uniref:Uncharacterized protein n=1 Tax=Aegilops tauschii TaxID=37682 RepID=M8CQP9_AEGTA
MPPQTGYNVDTGVNKHLTEMITKSRRPGQELLVGKPEYKSIIETSLGIPCWHDELVMEVMWGLKRLLPGLVNEQIVATASVLFDCDAFEEKRSPGFRCIGRHLKKISGIESFKIICSREIDDSDEIESNHQTKTRHKDMLAVLVKKAKEAHEAELADVP